LISSSSTASQVDCASLCSSNSNCAMISFQSSNCKLFSKAVYSVNTVNSVPILFQKDLQSSYSSINAYLAYYWPFNNNLVDVIRGRTFTGTGISYGKDRLNSPSSALLLTSGYMLAQPDVYFQGDFTVSTWFYSSVAVVTNSRVIDCGNGAG
jgi:hypothetical protein